MQYDNSIGLVKEIGIVGVPTSHPIDKQLTVLSNGADHFVCEVPTGHESFSDMPILRKANAEEVVHFIGITNSIVRAKKNKAIHRKRMLNR